MSNSQKLIHDYFRFFKKKKINDLTSLLAFDVKLTDWENSFNGKKDVLGEIKRIFSETKKIDLEIIRINTIDLTNYCELKINMHLKDDTAVNLKVIDIIEYIMKRFFGVIE